MIDAQQKLLKKGSFLRLLKIKTRREINLKISISCLDFGVHYISLVTGNPVPAAVAVLAVTIAGIATMTVAVIYMVGTYQSPSADRVQSTTGCISRDGGITWICPYRYAF